MGTLKTKVESIVETRLPGATVFLEEIPLSDRLSGHVIWEGFNAMNARERQKQLRRAIREGLTPEEELQLSVVLALTPTEWHGIMEEAA
jgi:hypothetical protein